MGNAADWLEEGEEIIAQKSVSLDKAQYAGRLYVTSRAVHFHCNVEMVTVGLPLIAAGASARSQTLQTGLRREKRSSRRRA